MSSYQSQSVASTTSTNRVFQIEELLINIIVHVDRQTLLISGQRVCKSWHDHINHSSPLTRRLFLKIPIAASSSSDLKPRRTLNPLLVEAFPQFFKEVIGHEISDETCRAGIKPEDGFQKSKLFESIPMKIRTKAANKMKERITFYDMKHIEEEDRVAAEMEDNNSFLRDGASWLQMHVSDPPVTEFASYYRSSVQATWSKTWQTHSYPEGLRMRDLYTYLLRYGLMNSSTNCSIAVAWSSETTASFKMILGRKSRAYGFFNDSNENTDYQVENIFEAQMVVNLLSLQGCVVESYHGDSWKGLGRNFFGYNKNYKLWYKEEEF